MTDDKIYTQEDLNNAVTQAIKDMQEANNRLLKACELMAEEYRSERYNNCSENGYSCVMKRNDGSNSYCPQYNTECKNTVTTMIHFLDMARKELEQK